jgi:hypothetical protein
MEVDLASDEPIDWEDQEDKYEGQCCESSCCSSHHSTLPCEYGQFVQPSDKIPARGDIARNEDANRQGRERVYRHAMASAWNGVACSYPSLATTGQTIQARQGSDARDNCQSKLVAKHS